MGEESLDHLEPRSVVAVARRGARLALGEEALERVRASRRHVERIVRDGRPVYGLPTGFGALATTGIPAGERLQLQRSLLRSHAAGMVPFVVREVVRSMIVIRSNTLVAVLSGVLHEHV